MSIRAAFVFYGRCIRMDNVGRFFLTRVVERVRHDGGIVFEILAEWNGDRFASVVVGHRIEIVD